MKCAVKCAHKTGFFSTQGSTQWTQVFFSAQNDGAQGSAQRKQVFVRNDVRTEMAFFSRKNISRTTSRSKSLYFLANRASANSDANSKIAVSSLLVTSEMILSKLQLSSELSSKMLVDRKMKATNK